MAEMVKRAEFKNLNEEQIREQIVLRKDLIKTMVGSLYPEIVQDEIYELQEYLEKEVINAE